MAVGRGFLMLKADDEVHCILAQFIGLKASTRLPVTSKITSLKGIPRSCASSRSNQGINALTGVFHLFATRRWFALECSRQTRLPSSRSGKGEKGISQTFA